MPRILAPLLAVLLALSGLAAAPGPAAAQTLSTYVPDSVRLRAALRRGPVLGLPLGDSRYALQIDGLGLSNAVPQHWIGLLSGGAISFPTALNAAVGGEKTDQTLQRLVVGGAGGTYQGISYAALSPAASGGTGVTGPVLSLFRQYAGSGIVFLIAPINDHNTPNNFPLGTMKANLQAQIDALLDAGLEVVIYTSHPHDAGFSPAWTAQQIAYQNNVRDWLLQKAGTPGLTVIDIADLILDPATGLATSASLKDQTHWTVRTSFLVARRTLAALQPRLSPVALLPRSSADAYDAANNPRGNLIGSVAMMAGIAGTVCSGALGEVATGWTLACTNTGGLTIMASKAVSATYGTCQQVSVMGTTTSAADIRVELYPSAAISTAAAPVGAVLEGAQAIEVDAGTSNVRMAGFGFSTIGSGVHYYDGAMASANPTTLPEFAYAGVLRVPAFTVPAGTTGTLARTRLFFPPSSNVSIVVRICPTAVRRISAHEGAQLSRAA